MSENSEIEKLENLPEDELTYEFNQIESATPYLNEISYTKRTPQGEYRNFPLPIRWRAFAWYYCHNYGNAADAYRRMKKRRMVPNNYRLQSVESSQGHQVLQHQAVKEAIETIRKEIKKNIEEGLPMTIIEQLKVQAFYDRSIFFNVDGSLAFDSWEQIPEKYRCCVEGMERRITKYGPTVVLRLVNRSEALEKLTRICPDLLQPEKRIIISESDEILNAIHKTKQQQYKPEPENNI